MLTPLRSFMSRTSMCTAGYKCEYMILHYYVHSGVRRRVHVHACTQRVTTASTCTCMCTAGYDGEYLYNVHVCAQRDTTASTSTCMCTAGYDGEYLQAARMAPLTLAECYARMADVSGVRLQATEKDFERLFCAASPDTSQLKGGRLCDVRIHLVVIGSSGFRASRTCRPSWPTVQCTSVWRRVMHDYL